MDQSSKIAPYPKPLSLRPEQVGRRFSAENRQKGPWPAWLFIRWEDAFLFRRCLQKLWDILSSTDPAAERIVLYPKDTPSVETLLHEIATPSLFSSTRLIIAHVQRPVKKTVPLEKLARQISTMPEQTFLVLAAEGMSPLTEEMNVILQSPPPTASGKIRECAEISVWRPFNHQQLLDVAKEILGAAGVRADELTLNFWLERVGSNLDRLQTEAKRLKLQFADGEATQDRLEEIFEVAHVHDETIWNALRAILTGECRRSTESLQTLLQSTDGVFTASEISRTMLCAQALSGASAEGVTVDDIFLRFEVKGKRRQGKMMELALRMKNMDAPPTALAARLLALDLSLKQAKTAAGRQEVLLRTLLALCSEPEPAG